MLAEALSCLCLWVMASFLYSIAASRASIASSNWNSVRSSWRHQRKQKNVNIKSLVTCRLYYNHWQKQHTNKIDCSSTGLPKMYFCNFSKDITKEKWIILLESWSPFRFLMHTDWGWYEMMTAQWCSVLHCCLTARPLWVWLWLGHFCVEFTCSSCMCVGYLWALQLRPTAQNIQVG